MKYLSDLLYVDIPTTNFKGENTTYQVWMVSPILRWVDDIATYGEREDLIYTGNIYGTGNDARVYLNDIIATYVYDNSYVIERKKDTPRGVLFHIKITSPKLDQPIYVDADPYIMNYYKDAKVRRYDNMFPLSSQIPLMYNLLTQRTQVLPRIPRLSYVTDNIWFSALTATTTNASDEEYNIVGVKGENEIAYNLTYPNRALINAVSFTGNDYYNITEESHTLYYTGYIRNNYSDGVLYREIDKAVPVAYIDECPAEYYLIWIDRTGAYQCQPFSGKNTLSESISTSYIDGTIDFKKVSDKNITCKWNLNTSWLSEDEYKAYESLLTSKYVYLFNTEYDEGYDVIVDTNSWTEKTRRNRDKMYNLTISVKTAQTQNIIY